MIRHKLIRQTAAQILRENEIDVAPVDVAALAERQGIAVIEESLGDDSFSGFLYREHGKKSVIGVNKDHHPNRKRFTIAHELGHFFLHPNDGIHYDRQLVQFRHSTVQEAREVDEIEANRFAAEILMPPEMLIRDIELVTVEISEVEDALDQLARNYQVSTQALSIRLERLGLLARA